MASITSYERSKRCATINNRKNKRISSYVFNEALHKKDYLTISLEFHVVLTMQITMMMTHNIKMTLISFASTYGVATTENRMASTSMKQHTNKSIRMALRELQEAHSQTHSRARATTGIYLWRAHVHSHTMYEYISCSTVYISYEYIHTEQVTKDTAP